MTEREAYDALAAAVPRDARVWVERNAVVSTYCPDGIITERVRWSVLVEHHASGFVKRQMAVGETAIEAVGKALAKWRAYQLETSFTGVPRWVLTRGDGGAVVCWRVHVSDGRLFARTDKGAVETGYLVDHVRRIVTVSEAIPTLQRRGGLAAAIGMPLVAPLEAA